MSMLTFHPLNDYKVSLLRLLKAFESPHADARDVKDGKITIGLGFNLNAKPEVRKAVINELLGTNFQTSPGTSAQQAIERDYADQLDKTIQQTSLAVSQRITQLNAIMAARAANTALNGYADNRRTTFAFSSNAAQLNTEVDRVFDFIRPLYETDLQRAFPAIAQGAGFIPGFANSREQAILFSFVYNGGTGLVGSSLKAAITSGDRARAWYEIRYQSNKLGWAQINGSANAAQQSQITSKVDSGLAKRRYFEAQVFGLYAGTTATQPEAQDALRMLTEFRTEIFKYENAYGTRRDGSAGSRGDKVASAIADFVSLADLARAQSLIAAFDPAKTTLLADLKSRYAGYAAQLTASYFLSINIYLAKVGIVAQLDSGGYETSVFAATNKNDLMIGDSKGDLLSGNGGSDVLFGEGGDDFLYGGAGSDLLIGGSDDDVLFGGAGDDTLVGGAGDDTYVIHLSDGQQHDTIFDSDAKGSLIIYGKDGTRLNTVILRKQDGSALGLHDNRSDTPTAEDAKPIYAMRKKRRDTILAYEALYGTGPDNNSASLVSQRIAAANSDYHVSGNAEVQTLYAVLIPVRDAFQSGSAMRIADDELAMESVIDTVTDADSPVKTSYAYNELVGQFAILAPLEVFGNRLRDAGAANDPQIEDKKNNSATDLRFDSEEAA